MEAEIKNQTACANGLVLCCFCFLKVVSLIGLFMCSSVN